MIFPGAGLLPRHPSQLYELCLEGILLFVLLWWFSSTPRPRMAVSGFFAVGYSVARCIAEIFRVPDPQYGYLAFGWLTMGQLLTIPLFLFGALLLFLAYKHQRTVEGE